jgi:hypothetical protein
MNEAGRHPEGPTHRRMTQVFVLFAIIAGFFLVAEHWAHVIPYLPWLLVLACPLMHVFMHHGHGGHGHGGRGGTDGRTVEQPGRDGNLPVDPSRKTPGSRQ